MDRFLFEVGFLHFFSLKTELKTLFIGRFLSCQMMDRCKWNSRNARVGFETIFRLEYTPKCRDGGVWWPSRSPITQWPPSLLLCPVRMLSVMGLLTHPVPNFSCFSSLLSTLRRKWDHRRQRSQTSGPSPGALCLERERCASSQGPLKDFVPPAPLCSPSLLWVVKGWEVHQTHALILGREPRFQ